MTTSVATFQVQEGGGHGFMSVWSSMANAENGDSIQRFGGADRSVQVAGTLSGASVTIQGSNDGTNWATLHDPQGMDLVFASPGILAICETTRFIRPSVAGGGVGTAVSVTFLSKTNGG